MSEQPDKPAEPQAPIPLLVCHGEGYVTKPDGTVIHFVLDGEVK